MNGKETATKKIEDLIYKFRKNEAAYLISAKPNKKHRSVGSRPARRGRIRPNIAQRRKRDANIAARVRRGKETYQEIGNDHGLSIARVHQIGNAMLAMNGNPNSAKRRRGRRKNTRLSKRDASIAARVRRGETYQQIGNDHGLSRERIRQIASALKVRPGRRRLKYGACPRCCRILKKHDAASCRRPSPVDVRNKLCGRCRTELYDQPVVLICRCGRVKTMKYGKLRWMQLFDKSAGLIRLDANGRAGTYLCRQCFRDFNRSHGLCRGPNRRVFKEALRAHIEST